MKSGTCPKCGSNEILSELPLHGGEGHPSYVDIVQPEPPNRPSFGWRKANKVNLWHIFVVLAAILNFMPFAIKL